MDATAGAVPAVLSTDAIARDGFSVDQNGWELDSFLTNPVTLFNHDDGMNGTRNLPIGRWRDVGLNAEGQLAGVSDLDMEDDFARQVAGKIERGLINATSVRWIPLEHRIEKRDAGSEPENLLVFTRSELLEASIVVLPADPRAVILRSDGPTEFSLDEFTTPSRALIDPISLVDVIGAAVSLVEARSEGVFTPAEQEAAERLYATITERIPGLDAPERAHDEIVAALDGLIPVISSVIEDAERLRAKNANAATRVLERAFETATGKTLEQLRRKR
jgi:hypothetical protein